MKRACPLSWECSKWAGISNLSVFVSLHNSVCSKCRDLRLRWDSYISQSGGWKPESRVRMWPSSGEEPPPVGTLQTSRDEEGSLGSLPAGPHHSQCPTFQHCDISSYCSAVWIMVVKRWWDRKHLLWLLLKTFIIFLYFFFIVVPRLPGTGQTVDEDLLNEQTIPTLPTAGCDC